MGSTVSYLQRYTLLAALGLATADQDDDGVATGGPIPASEQQLFEIGELAKGLNLKAADWAPSGYNLLPDGARRLRELTEAQAAALIARLTQAEVKADLATGTAAAPAHDPLLDAAEPVAVEPAADAPAEPDDPEPVADGMPTGEELRAELATIIEKLNAKDEREAFAACGIHGDWREAPDTLLLKLLGNLLDRSNA